MRVGWCYIGTSGNFTCFKTLRNKPKSTDWIKGYVLDKKVTLMDLNEYSVFVSDIGEIWYYQYEATVSFNHPSNFIQ